MIPLYKPFMPEVPLVDTILHSGELAYGKYGKKFEKSLIDFFGAPYLITTNTFNMAILIALSTLGLKSGDSIIASPMACLASTQPILSMGIKILWADVEPKTGTLSPDSVIKLLKKNPKAIIHNHFCGHIGFVEEINAIGKDFHIPVIDDCIEAFGSEYEGNKIGNLDTDITIFSFGPVRIPNTIDGGAVIFKDKGLYNKSLLVRDAGIDRSRFRDELGEINPELDIALVGHSATLDEVRSYIGLKQMENIDWILKTQRENAKSWNSFGLDKYNVVPIIDQKVNPNYWVYCTLSKDKRNTIMRFREKWFYASGVHINNNRYSVFGHSDKLPGVDEFYNSFIALPCGWWINANEIR